MTEALNASKVEIDRKILQKRQEEIEIMQLEVLYSVNTDRFYDIILSFKDLNIQLGSIFNAVRNETNNELKLAAEIQHNEESLKLKRKADELKGLTSVLCQPLVVTPDKSDCSYYEIYMENVQCTKEKLRNTIGKLMKMDVDQARVYNELLNKSKKLNKIVPKQMPKCLYETKNRKYHNKIRD